jgi:hypothetical protein
MECLAPAEDQPRSGRPAVIYEIDVVVATLGRLQKVAAAHPAVELHVVCDNYATHKHPAVKAWLKGNPRVTLHFTPTGCSWLNNGRDLLRRPQRLVRAVRVDQGRRRITGEKFRPSKSDRQLTNATRF